MGYHFDVLKMMRSERRRVILPDGIGTVEIVPITRSDGSPGYRVDVQSDTDRYGPAVDGRNYAVENGDPGPGVVFLTGREVSRETYPDVCDDGCGKHVDHKVNGDPECGPR